MIKIKNMFYLEGNPTYKLFERMHFDSVKVSKILQNPSTNEMVDGVIFYKNKYVVCHLTLKNLLYVYLIDESYSQLKSKFPESFVQDVKTHSGYIESKPRSSHNPNREMLDVYIQGTKFSHFILK
jgi:hypothetical protein